MKKSAQTRNVARTNEAARARRAARSAKAGRTGRTVLSSRAAQTTLAAAIGAGILLQGGQESAVAAQPLVVVMQDVALRSDDTSTEPGPDGGSDGSTSEEGTSGSGGQSTGDSDIGDSSRRPIDDDGTATVGTDERESSTTATKDDPTPSSQTATVPTVSPRTPTSETIAESAPVPSRTADPAPARPGSTRTRGPVPVVAPTGGTSSGAAVAGSATSPTKSRPTVADVTPQIVGTTVRSTTKVRVTQAAAQNLLTRIALGFAGIVTPPPAGGAPGPSAPAAPSGALLIAQWALFRRGGHVFNQSPVSHPTQASSSTGEVVGDLHAEDPDGDHLTYTVVGEPAHGRVTVNQDGTFTYTPDPDLRAAGGTDAFTVVVRDNDAAMPGGGRYTDLLRAALSRHPVLAARLFGPHAISVTVPITIAPSVTVPPPTGPTPTVDRGTGAVSGSIGVPTVQGVPLVVTVPQQPSAGSVVVQPNGTYTFTPTAAARRAAAGTPGSDVVTFTVLVSDGKGGETPVEVTAAVDPGPAEVVAEIPVGPGVQRLETSPDGRRVYAIGGTGVSGARTFGAMRAAVAPSGASTAGSTISIIDAASNTLISTVTLPGKVDTLTFSPDGARAFVITHDDEERDRSGTVTVIDVGTDAVVATIEAADTGRGVVFGPDGKHAYLSDYGSDAVVVVDLGDNSTTTIPVTRPQGLFFSPDGRRIYTPNIMDGTTTVIDASTNSVIGSVPGYGEPHFGVDGRYGYLVDLQYGGVDSVTVIDTVDDSVQVIPVGAYPSNIQFGANGAFAFVVSSRGDSYDDDRQVTVINTADQSSSTIDVGPGYGSLNLSPDGTRGYIVDQAGTVTVIDTAHGALVKTVDIATDGNGFVDDVQFSPDGSRFYVVESGRTTVFHTVDDSVTTIDGAGRLGFTSDGSYAYVLDRAGLSESTLRLASTVDDSVRTFTVPISADLVYFSPDGGRAYLGSWSGSTLAILDTTTGAVTPVQVGRQSYEPQFSPDGRQLFVVGYEYTDIPGGFLGEPGTVTVIGTVDDSVRTVPVGRFPNRVSFAPDGIHAYVVSDREADASLITVIDRTDGTSTSFEGSPYATDVEFTPDGRYAYTFGYHENSGDGEIMFIDLADGASSVVPVPAPTGIRFSPDGHFAYVLNSRDGTATVIALEDLDAVAAKAQA